MKSAVLVLLLSCFAQSAHAIEIRGAARTYLETQVRSWASDPMLIAAIQAQNTAHAALTEGQILSLDSAWRAEISAASRPTIEAVLDNPAAEQLRAHVAASDGTLIEAFIMDNRGLNVATAALTSDYWQGDEDKFSATYGVGPGALHIGDVEFDESSQLYEVQVSFTLVDPASGAAIGAMTVGLNAEALE